MPVSFSVPIFNFIRYRTVSLLSVVFASMLLTACASSGEPSPKEASKLDLTIFASDDVNGDEKGASPIQVRVYELKSDKAFNDADFFSLTTNEKAMLDDDVLKKNKYILRPGQNQTIARTSSPETTAIGIIAGYRDLKDTVWRAVYTLPIAPDASWMRAIVPANKVKLHIALESTGIAIQDKNKKE